MQLSNLDYLRKKDECFQVAAGKDGDLRINARARDIHKTINRNTEENLTNTGEDNHSDNDLTRFPMTAVSTTMMMTMTMVIAIISTYKRKPAK